MKIAWALAMLLERHLCQFCHGIIWPGQARHAARHRRCSHAEARRLWLRATNEYGYNIDQWPCDFCGIIP